MYEHLINPQTIRERFVKSMKHLDLQVRLAFYAGKNLNNGTFGKGIATLLQGVDQYGSLNAAAKKIRMAYSKAWRIVKETEAGFGFNLIDRDGARGSELTPEGRKLLDAYLTLEDIGNEYLSLKFKELLIDK
jgi:molybdate transport system regulatory protein